MDSSIAGVSIAVDSTPPVGGCLPWPPTGSKLDKPNHLYLLGDTGCDVGEAVSVCIGSYLLKFEARSSQHCILAVFHG